MLHFTPPHSWMNDPNGLVRVGATFHLFYQHNPEGLEHENLHWGHAVSSDLFAWTHLPVALAPDELGEIFSGTAVVDRDDTAGFGRGSIVAVFTHAARDRQSQSLAFSTDGGVTWEKYAGNPVIEPPEGVVDFRDPKVVRYQPDSGDPWWAMALAVGHDVWFYRSVDLKRWERVSVFAPERPWPGATIEVPELLQVPVIGENRTEWVLILSVHERLPDGSITGEVLWAPGRFDGLTFESARDMTRMERLDHGTHFYASTGWQNGPNDVPVLIGWMDERDRLLNPPPQPWCGRMSIPRELRLRSSAGGYVLEQRPLLACGVFAASHQTELPAGRESTVASLPRVFRASLRFDGLPDGVRVVLQSEGDLDERFELAVRGPHLSLEANGRNQAGPSLIEVGRTDPFLVEMIVDTGSIEVFVDGGARAASFVGGIGLAPTKLEVANASDLSGELRIDSSLTRDNDLQR